MARQLERNDFSARYKSGKPINLHEFFYPILQAYDSFELKADVEIGGTDQTFNLLLGRELQQMKEQSPQTVISLPLLEGMDGVQKMSKSLNNAISFNDSAKDMYGKIMKISDELLIKYWKLFTEGERDLEKQQDIYHPKKEKEQLAWLLVCSFYGPTTADEIQKEFTERFSKKSRPKINQEYTAIEQIQALSSKINDLSVKINDLLTLLELTSSKSEAKRKILEGAVKIWNEQEETPQKITDPNYSIVLKENQKRKENQKGKEFIISVGKRKFQQVNTKWEWIHDLKAYLIYRIWKETGADKNTLCENLSKDTDFRNYISSNSIKMKLGNYHYLETKEGLSNYSNQSKEVYDFYKKKEIEEIEKDIKNKEIKK